jgi:hypothetical protein
MSAVDALLFDSEEAKEGLPQGLKPEEEVARFTARAGLSAQLSRCPACARPHSAFTHMLLPLLLACPHTG